MTSSPFLGQREYHCCIGFVPRCKKPSEVSTGLLMNTAGDGIIWTRYKDDTDASNPPVGNVTLPLNYGDSCKQWDMLEPQLSLYSNTAKYGCTAADPYPLQLAGLLIDKLLASGSAIAKSISKSRVLAVFPLGPECTYKVDLPSATSKLELRPPNYMEYMYLNPSAIYV